MKALPFLLAVGSLAIGTAQARTVVLTPADVVNGIEINAAIDTATQHGTEPGKVVFDGQHTGFSCAINEDSPENNKLTFIQYSNLQLVGINGADTGDGICNVVFADAPLENILIEGLKIASFIEEGTGISARGLSVRKNVTIRKNDISGAMALQAFNAVDWKIYSNTMGRSRDLVVSLVGMQDSEIIGNTISGFPGILMSSSETQDTTGNRLIANRFSDSQGITLRGAASRNIVALNTGECPVVVLEADTTQNRVLFNRAPSATCGEYGAVQDLGSGNRVFGNKP
jgi:hypothetical protein